MAVLTLRSAAHRLALVQAVDFMIDQLGDQLSNAAHDLGNVLSDPSIDATMQSKLVGELRQKVLFVRAFKDALDTQQVGVSVFVEGIEVQVLRDGLEALVDIEDDTASGVYEVISADNIKRIILATSMPWGATDPDKLASALRKEVTEAMEGNGAARELLAQLS